MKHRQRVRKHHEHHVGVNGRVALVVTRVVGTMYCAYVFVAIALVGVPAAIKGPKEFVAWVSSQFIQLVLLPVIIVGQNIQGASSDERAEATYKDAEAVLKAAERIEKHLQQQDEELARLIGAARKK